MIPEEQVQEPVTYSLAPFSGTWTTAEAAHLLRRTMFGPTLQQIKDAVTNGLDATMTQLLTPPTFTQPLAFLPEETITPFGFSWVTSVYPTNTVDAQYHENARRDSLNAWLIQRVNVEGVSIHEKMCLFWQNHFAASATFDSRATYDYFNLIRSNALGNFKQLVKDITINPCMLVFLNGAENNLFSPNENYARELLELYTIGKGPQIGPGDYTNYTEQDVAEGAKILTGWTIQGFLSDTDPFTTSVFNPALHDATTKTLSAHFGNASVPNANELEYSNYIDIIFQQAETAKFICRKLYRWFVNYDITPTIESTIIADMATTLSTNNFEILPVVDELLKSQHFYDISMRGSIIKNPLEVIFSMFNSTSSVASFDLNSNYRMYLNCGYGSSALGMNYLVPPNVGGWTAYYQAPNFSKLWINSSYIKLRFDFASYITLWGGIVVDTNAFQINHLGFLDALTTPNDPVQVIDDLELIFCPKGLSVLEKAMLKTILTNGLPDFEWTIQYDDYIAHPGDQTYSDPVKMRLALTLDQLFKLPEFQTI